jgi:fibronectin-binding autotransporter adhesin
MKPKNPLLALLLGAAFLAAPCANAADGTWTLNNNGNWSLGTNWSGGTVADGTDFSAFFSDVISGNRNITVDSARIIGHIYAQDTSHNYAIIGANTLTLDTSSGPSILDVVSGRTLTISAPLTINDGLQVNGAGTTSLTGAITLGASQTWDNSGTLSISGIIGDGGNAYSLTKTGTGRLLLLNSASNQGFSGGLTVNGGELEFRRSDNGTTNTTLGAGNLAISGGVVTAYWGYSLSRVQGTGAGEIQITGGVSGFGGNGSSGGTFNIGDVTWGSATFNPTEFVLQYSNANTNGNSTFQSNIDLNGADRIIRSDQTGGDIVNGVGRFTGNITNGGATAKLTKTGIGTHILSGTNTYDGGTTIDQGTLRFDKIAAMPDSGNVQVNNGAILGIKLGGAGNWSTGTTGVGTLGGLLAGDGGAGTSTVGYSGNVGVQLEVAATSTYSGDIANVGTTLAIHKTGGSSLTLNGNNTYSGGTFLYQGSLIADSATALGSGDISFNGGTLQYTANSAANDYGSRIKNSTSAITLNTNGQNVGLSGMAAGNTGGLTKSGAGTLTLTGANTYSGATTLSAGTIAVYNGTLNTSGGAVSMAASNTSISVLGGTGVSSTWNLGGQQLGTGNGGYSNLQMVIDGDGVAGSALVTNVGILAWGRTATNSTMLLTDGGQMNVNGEVRIGNPYYLTTGGANMTIGGGTATSTFTGNSASAFYIGFGERENSNNNVVTVNSGGVLTGVGDMFVGHVNNQQGNGLASTANQLTVTGTGTASVKSITVGYAQNAGIVSDLEEANANVVEVTSGGTLTTSAVSYIGRTANAGFTESNANTLTVTGTGSSWNAGNQNVFVGFTANAGATSNDNILTVGTGGSVTNVDNLTVGSGTGAAIGNQLVVNGILSATTVTISTGNTLSGSGAISGAVTVSGALNPGNSPGQLTINDSLTLGATASTTFELGGTALGTGYDNITLGAAATALAYGGDLVVANYLTYDMALASQVYDLFSLGAVTATGDFSSVTVNGLSLSFSTGDWTATDGSGSVYLFTQSTGNLAVTVIPEPSAALLGLLGALGLLIRRKR